jgi:glycosyltransferase involved in cell wall biosynthesis
VPDIRPYVAHAALSASPLRIARGIQNKVLEAMAMGTPVLASTPAFEGVDATSGRDLLVADTPTDLAAAAIAVLLGRHPDIGPAGRALVERRYTWSGTLTRLDRIIDGLLGPS